MVEVSEEHHGEQFWKSKVGAKRRFETPEALWRVACEYFEWNRTHPLKEHKVFHTDGRITGTYVYKARAMTLTALCIYLGISRTCYYNKYKKRSEFAEVIERIEEVILTQKFEMAAADLLNASFIARDLNMREGVDLSSGDGSMSPKAAIDASKLSDAALREILAAAAPGEAPSGEDDGE